MKPGLKQKFLERWNKHFPNAFLPITFYYAESTGGVPMPEFVGDRHCFVDDLRAVCQGDPVAFNVKTVICPGGKLYLGFTQSLMPNFEYFLSCGIPGKLEGERYKKSPELVLEFLKNSPMISAPAPFIIFKRWDILNDDEEPMVVVFFAPPDVLAGLFTLANYDEPTNEAVYCPMGAGCATIVRYPMLELRSNRPRAVLGMFDISARPWVDPRHLTFAVPFSKFECMVDNMDESFLITESWQKIKGRLSKPQ